MANMETTMSTAIPSSNADKPLPAPPEEGAASQSPAPQTPGPVTEEMQGLSGRPQAVKRPSLSSTQSFQRPKKRVLWRGKACLIALPLENGKDENGEPKKYLQPHEVEDKMQSWVSKGFDTDGFNLSDGSFGNYQGQSRNIYPESSDYRSETTTKDYRVNIPNIKAWNDYKKELQEAKLRALGVSFGDDPPARTSPTPSNSMSRQGSQSSMVPSHPGAPQSATGFRNQMDNGFSPPFPAQANPFVRPQSMMSPELPQGPPGGFHFPRQSIAFGPGQTFNNMALPLQSASPALSGPLSQQLSSHSNSRGVSPFLDARRQSIRQTQSPITTLQETDDEVPFQGQSNLLPHLRPSATPVQKQQTPGSMNGLQPLAEHQESSIVEPARFTSHPDIASPMPQGASHRHNVSESLQREIDDAEYHLEESIRRQLEDDEEKEKTSSKKPAHPEPEPLVSLATEDSGGSKNGSKEDLEEIQTNPSIPPSPKPAPVSEKQPTQPNRSKHSSKSSTSKLNVNAKEFVFDPTKSFTPSGMSTFGAGSNFGGSFMERQTSGNVFSPPGVHSKTGSNISSFSGSFNASAPAFTPQMSQPSSIPQANLQSFNIPKRDFSFSSQMPSFGAGTNTFGAGSGLGISGAEGEEDKEKPAAPKIFNVNLSDIIKPAKKSKAIPIVKPSSESSHDSEDNDAEDGRIDRSESRMKRVRRKDGSGDEVPRFATPSREVSMEPQARSSSVYKRTARSISITKDEFASPQQANGQLKELLDGLQSSRQSPDASAVDEPNSKNLEGTGNQGQPSRKDEGPALTENPAKGNAQPPAKAEEKKKVSLSASAKAFNFNPSAGNFQPGLPPEIPSFKSGPTPVAKADEKAQQSAKPDEKKDSPSLSKEQEITSTPAPAKPAKNPFSLGLGASRFATEPSPTQSPPSKPEKVTEPVPDPVSEPVSEPVSATGPEKSVEDSEKQMEDRIMNGVTYVEPSYQELDDVMRQLNGDDSDIGVERNTEETWRSPARSNGSARRSSLGQRDLDSLEKTSQFRPATNQIVTDNPNKLQQPFQFLPREESGSSDSRTRELVSKNARFSPSYRPSRVSDDQDSPINRLNGVEQVDISDWNDVVDSGDEDKFLTRTAFFDSRINELVGDAMDKRLMPLEHGLANINSALTHLGSRSGSRRYRRSLSADIEDSDADDEDDVTQSRALSPLKDRKFEKLKASIFESIGAQKLAPSQEEFDKITSSLAELKTALHERPQAAEPAAGVPVGDDLAKLLETVTELKASLAQQQERAAVPQESSAEAVQLKETLAQLKELHQTTREQPESGSTAALKKTIEDSISRAMRGKSGPVTSSHEAAVSEKLQLQVAGLESKLKVAESRAEEDFKARREVEDTLSEVQRSLTNAQADAAKFREVAEDTEESLKSFLNGQQEAKQHSAMLEEVNAAREKTISDLSDKTAALEDTLEEYRKSYQQKKDELEEAGLHMKSLDEENQNLDKTVHEMKSELEDGVKAKQLLKEKFDLLQEEMSKTAQTITKDQSAWRHKEEEHKAKHELQKARLEAEARTRERLEMEIDRLEKQEKEAMKARFMVEQIRNENGHLVGLVNELRTKHNESEQRSNQLARDLHNAEEEKRHEINRIMQSTKADVGAANQQVNILRASLEAVIERLESQVESMKSEAKDSKHRYESLLEEASASKAIALREAAEAREAALQEHYRFHERTLEEARVSHERALADLEASQQRKLADMADSHKKALEELHIANKNSIKEVEALQVKTLETTMDDHNRAMTYIRQDHERALHVAVEDKRMTENYLNGRITVADEQLGSMKERVAHLEERLELAKSAAQAAAEAAKAARGTSPIQTAATIAGGSTTTAKGSELPEKISPQALRESIMVLQEQLHQRESQIEELETELSKVDKDAPNKLKEKEVEITWLRELLGVRLDDLQDIIQTLSLPSYNSDAVRDAAIRLRANLQMEQQEKERAMAGGQRFPSLSNLSQVAASPRSIPMAAAAAWGSWRKGQTSLGSLAEMAAPAGATVNTRSNSQTPSKSSSPQSFLSGLLTPPASNMRHTPGPSGRASSAPSRRPLGAYPTTPKRQISSNSQDNRRALSNMPPPPESPALLRGESYDQDASSGHYSLDRYVNEEDEIESSMDGPGSDEGLAAGRQTGNGSDEPFGPTLELAG